MTNQTPKISVLMSVYNGEKYLKEAVNSILNQTFTNFEFIIINDSSTNATANILNSYSDPRIKIITNSQNLGLTKSLNIGLKQAHGKYIARMDSDDISLLDRLEKQFNFLEHNQNIALIGSNVKIINEKGKIISLKKKPSDPDLIKFSLLTRNPFIHSTFFFRHDLIISANGYNENFPYAQDYELSSRLALKYKLSNIEEPLLLYRQNSDSISYSLVKRKVQLEKALTVSSANISHYLQASSNLTPFLFKIINNEYVNFWYLLKALRLYHHLRKAYFNKENLSPATTKKIAEFYKKDQLHIYKSFFKRLLR